MGRLFRLVAFTTILGALAGIGQAQAHGYDDDYDSYYYSYYYSYRPRVYYYAPTQVDLQSDKETLRKATGTLPGVHPRFRSVNERDDYSYNRYNYGYYGGYTRASTCGRYHYWNGGYCEDARWRSPFRRHYPVYRYVYLYD